MADFAHVLQRVEGRLRAPEPQRSRILLEMAQDLEALYGEYLARGYSEGESRARAEALLASSEEALEMLDGVHTSVAARLLRRLSAPGARGERRLLTLLGSFAVLAGSYPLFAAGLPYTRAINLAPLVLIAALAATIVGRLALRVHLSHRSQPSLVELSLVPGFAALIAAAGVFMVLMESWRSLSALSVSGSAGPEFGVAYLVTISAILTFSLAVALATLLAWFHLRRRVLLIAALRMAIDGVGFSHSGGGR